MTASEAILVEGLKKQYGFFRRITALDSVNLSVQAGDIFALIGPNGAGKTTLMGCMLALLRPNAGSIRIFGKPADALDVRKVTGFLPERPSFETWMTATEFLNFHLMLTGNRTKTSAADVKSTLAFVGLEEVANRKLAKFSRGMLQRIGLAQVIIGKPKICFLDEPTSGMDPPGMDLVRRVLLRLRDDGATVIVNSHHLDEVARVCNRFAFMRKGRVELDREVDAFSGRLLVVRFPREQEGPSGEFINQLLAPHEVELKESHYDHCKLVLPARESAPRVIKELVDGGVPVEEVFFERSNLMDLFDDE